MEYGKPFGVGTSGGVAILGTQLGYGWVVLGASAVTVVGIIAIRIFFRYNTFLGQ